MKHIKCACRNASLSLCIGILAACGGVESSVNDTTDAGASPPAPTLNLSAPDIKTLRLDWSTVAGTVEYRVMASPDGVQPFVQIGTEPAGILQHTLEVFLPDQLNARYRVSACDASGCKDSAPVTVSAAVLNAGIGYFKSPNATRRIGATPIAISHNGHVLAIGAPRDSSNATGIDGDPDNTSAASSGAVFVFERSATGWVQQAYIKASNAEAFDSFGQSLSLSANGLVLAVGAPGEDSQTMADQHDDPDQFFDAGAVYLFERSAAGPWAQTRYLKAENPSSGLQFGWAVALAGDGDTLAVGAPQDSSQATGIGGDPLDSSAPVSGAAFVFARAGATWTQQAYIKASNTGEQDAFGVSLALSGNGDTLVVGADGEDSAAQVIGGDGADDSAPDAGAAYVFARDSALWSQQAYLKPSDALASDHFGRKVAISSDGETIAIGSNPTGVGSRTQGTAYVFTRSGSAWSEQAIVRAAVEGDAFGYSLALSDDGNRLAVGAPDEDSASQGLNGLPDDNAASAAGAAYLFRRSGTSWSQAHYLKASNAERLDRFGNELALSGDGQTLAVGAPDEDSAASGIGGNQADNSVSSRGAIYLY